ncbi:hypothetical protein UlMin_012077 [Ulmus minor]
MANKNCFTAPAHIPKAIWLKVWNHKLILPRHKLLWWQMLSNCLPLREKLNSLFLVDNICCPLCNLHTENAIHLLFFCDVSRHIWLASPWNIRIDDLVCNSLVEGLKFLWHVEALDSSSPYAQVGNRNIFLFASALFDHIWKNRNAVIHGDATQDFDHLFFSISKSYQSALDSLAINWSPTPPPRRLD